MSSLKARSGRRERQSFASRLSGVRTRKGIFWAFAAIVFLLGGASRADVMSLIVLRPLSILACGYVLLISDLRPFSQFRAIGIILIALLLTAIAQLIPLPPAVWQPLPGRELITNIDKALGLNDSWRPLTLSPSRTVNTLFSLGVPIAALLMYSALGPDRRTLAVRVLLAAGFASALLGIFQLVGPANGALYTYEVTNGEAPVGLFANRNHNAIFLASLIPLVTFVSLRATLEGSRQQGQLYQLIAAGWVLVVIPLILIGGSRAGAIAALLSSLVSLALWLFLHGKAGRSGKAKQSRRKMIAVIACGLAAVAALILATLLNSRSVALERLFNASFSTEIRTQLMPLLWEMMKAYFPVGTGFGTFEAVYKVHEPHSALSTRYLNQAHNDLMQFGIEAGLAGVLIIAGGLIWFFYAGIRAWRRVISGPVHDPAALLPLFGWASLATILGASLVDYPLRTPAMMFTGVLLCCLITGPSRTAPGSSPHRGGSMDPIQGLR